MIEWLRNKFSSIIGFLFVLTVIALVITGAVVGFTIAEKIGLFLGIVLGFLLGLFLGILTFGYFATIINISETDEAILKKIEEIRSIVYNANSPAESPDLISSSEKNVKPSTVSSEYKICKKCGAQNSINTTTCKDCGEYL